MSALRRDDGSASETGDQWLYSCLSGDVCVCVCVCVCVTHRSIVTGLSAPRHVVAVNRRDVRDRRTDRQTDTQTQTEVFGLVS